MASRTILLDSKQIGQKINRIAYQIYEDNVSEKEIVIAGIVKSGFILAKSIAKVLSEISPLKVKLVEIHIVKHSQLQEEINLSADTKDLHGKVVILVDDVINSGKTLMYSLKPFLDADIKKIRTAVLVDRDHKLYPVAADYIGICLATTLQEHVTAVLDKENETVFLS